MPTKWQCALGKSRDLLSISPHFTPAGFALRARRDIRRYSSGRRAARALQPAYYAHFGCRYLPPSHFHKRSAAAIPSRRLFGAVACCAFCSILVPAIADSLRCRERRRRASPDANIFARLLPPSRHAISALSRARLAVAARERHGPAHSWAFFGTRALDIIEEYFSAPSPKSERAHITTLHARYFKLCWRRIAWR